MPQFAPSSELKEAGERSMALDRSSASEIAVLLDDESFFYETCRYNLDIPLIFQQTAMGLAADRRAVRRVSPRRFSGGETPFLQALYFPESLPTRRHEEKRLVEGAEERGADRPVDLRAGYIKDAPARKYGGTDRDPLRLGEQPWGPLVHVTDFGHPITTGLSQDLFWGTNSKLAPLFFVDDSEARILGEVVYSQGNCRRDSPSRNSGLEIGLQRGTQPPGRCPARHRPVGGGSHLQ